MHPKPPTRGTRGFGTKCPLLHFLPFPGSLWHKDSTPQGLVGNILGTFWNYPFFSLQMIGFLVFVSIRPCQFLSSVALILYFFNWCYRWCRRGGANTSRARCWWPAPTVRSPSWTSTCWRCWRSPGIPPVFAVWTAARSSTRNVSPGMGKFTARRTSTGEARNLWIFTIIILIH